MELTTEEGNRLIAEFMGGKLKYYNISNEPYYMMPNKQQWMPERLVYHSDYNWLMDAVEKIESIKHPYHGRFAVIQCSNSCTIQSTNFKSDIKADPPYYYSDRYGDTKKQATWLAVVSFFQWYNSLPSIDTNLINKNKEG